MAERKYHASTPPAILGLLLGLALAATASEATDCFLYFEGVDAQVQYQGDHGWFRAQPQVSISRVIASPGPCGGRRAMCSLR